MPRALMNSSPVIVVVGVLTLLTILTSSRPALHGIPLSFGSERPCDPLAHTDPPALAHIQSEEQVLLNKVLLGPWDLDGGFERTFKNRAERWLFVSAEPDVPMQAVISTMDRALKWEANIVWLPRVPVFSKKVCPDIQPTKRGWRFP